MRLYFVVGGVVFLPCLILCKLGIKPKGSDQQLAVQSVIRIMSIHFPNKMPKIIRTFPVLRDTHIIFMVC